MSTINAVQQQRSSSCVDSISTNIEDGTVDVTFKTGSRYVYSGVNRDAISRLLSNQDISLGFFVHQHCIRPAAVSFKLIKA